MNNRKKRKWGMVKIAWRIIKGWKQRDEMKLAEINMINFNVTWWWWRIVD